MYIISNQERRDIIKLLGVLVETLPVGKSLRRANMVRVAGLLIRQLEGKTDVPREKARIILQDASKSPG